MRAMNAGKDRLYIRRSAINESTTPYMMRMSCPNGSCGFGGCESVENLWQVSMGSTGGDCLAR